MLVFAVAMHPSQIVTSAGIATLLLVACVAREEPTTYPGAANTMPTGAPAATVVSPAPAPAAAPMPSPRVVTTTTTTTTATPTPTSRTPPPMAAGGPVILPPIPRAEINDAPPTPTRCTVDRDCAAPTEGPRVAECNNATHHCEAVSVAAIHCGGFIANAHSCPNGLRCQLSSPYLPGRCVR
jgi:hypothetical protein